MKLRRKKLDERRRKSRRKSALFVCNAIAQTIARMRATVEYDTPNLSAIAGMLSRGWRRRPGGENKVSLADLFSLGDAPRRPRKWASSPQESADSPRSILWIGITCYTNLFSKTFSGIIIPIGGVALELNVVFYTRPCFYIEWTYIVSQLFAKNGLIKRKGFLWHI